MIELTYDTWYATHHNYSYTLYITLYMVRLLQCYVYTQHLEFGFRIWSNLESVTTIYFAGLHSSSLRKYSHRI